MPIDRFYIDKPLKQGVEVTLSGQEYHHLAHVTRAKVGESIELVNGCGILARGTISTLGKREGDIAVNKLVSLAPPKMEVTLVQAIPRLNRLDTIIEKGTELGVTKFILVPGDLSERKDLNAKQIDRLKSVIIAAMKQSGRLHLPEIEIFSRLNKWSELPSMALFGDLSSDAKTLVSAMEGFDSTKELFLFVGPESGFSDRETSHLKHLGAVGVTLSQNILRTDTAAIAMVAGVFMYAKSNESLSGLIDSH